MGQHAAEQEFTNIQVWVLPIKDFVLIFDVMDYNMLFIMVLCLGIEKKSIAIFSEYPIMGTGIPGWFRTRLQLFRPSSSGPLSHT